MYFVLFSFMWDNDLFCLRLCGVSVYFVYIYVNKIHRYVYIHENKTKYIDILHKRKQNKIHRYPTFT